MSKQMKKKKKKEEIIIDVRYRDHFQIMSGECLEILSLTQRFKAQDERKSSLHCCTLK